MLFPKLDVGLPVFLELSEAPGRTNSDHRDADKRMTTPDAQTDAKLLSLMLAGDEDALATLYQRRQGNIYRFALQMTGSPALAEDVAQEVFIVLMRDGSNFDPARGTVSAFLLGVARNHVLRRLDRDRFYVSMDGDSDGGSATDQLMATSDGPLDELSRSETIESVRRAVLSLPARYREVVVLCDLQEMSYVDAAGVLSCAVGTVRSRLHRARALLIEKLRPASAADAALADVKSARCFA
jgi:RNA polymerase sigma-70 factor (ECF subfamily)